MYNILMVLHIQLLFLSINIALPSKTKYGKEGVISWVFDLL